MNRKIGRLIPLLAMTALILVVVTAAYGATPANTVKPAVTNTNFQLGETVATSNGTWSNTPTSYTYAWQRCSAAGASCATIAGETASSYVLATSDIDHTLIANVTATNADGSATASSVATLLIADDSPPVNTDRPAVSGTATVGQALTVSNGTWTGGARTFTYQWKRCDAVGASCTAISGATATTYTLAAADAAQTLRVEVTAANPSGTRMAASDRTVAISQSLVNTVLPAITGTAEVGQTLTAINGTWTSPTPVTYALQWQRCDGTGASCTDITGSTAATRLVAVGDVAKTLRAKVTATNSTGSVTATSLATVVVAQPMLCGVAANKVTHNKDGSKTVSATDLTLPDRLVVDKVTFKPKKVTKKKQKLTVKLRVREQSSCNVKNAVVSIISVPGGLTTKTKAKNTANSGWVTFTVKTTTKLNRTYKTLTFYVQAHKSGEKANTGISASRLIVVKARLKK